MTASEGLVFVAFLFIGMGIGLLFHREDAGTLLGLGAGFLAMAYLRYKSETAGRKGSQC